MLEVRAGVFVGTLNQRVRQKLWDLIRSRTRDGGAVLIYRAANEQGFTVEMFGDTSRSLFDNEGLMLIRRPLEDAPEQTASLGAVKVRKGRQRR